MVVRIKLRTEKGLVAVHTVSTHGQPRHYVWTSSVGLPGSAPPERMDPDTPGWLEVTDHIEQLRRGSGRVTHRENESGIEIWQRRPANPSDDGVLPWPLCTTVKPDFARLRQRLPLDAEPRPPEQAEFTVHAVAGHKDFFERAPETVQQVRVRFRHTGLVLLFPTIASPMIAVWREVRYAAWGKARMATFEELWVDVPKPNGGSWDEAPWFWGLGEVDVPKPNGGSWGQLAWNPCTSIVTLPNHLRLRKHDKMTEWADLHGSE